MIAARASRPPLSLLLLLPLAALACRTTPTGATDPHPIEAARAPLTVVGLSDFHGALAAQVLTTAGGARVEVGGAALIGAYLERIRARAPGPVLLLDAGDMYQGTLVSGLAEGAPVIELYNRLGVAAAAVGNHEFDFGPVGPDSVVREESQDPRGALSARIEEASFPFLAANLRDESDVVPAPFAATHTLEVEGRKVGLVGLSSFSTASTTVAKNLAGLHFVDPVPVAVSEARRLRESGAELVIVIFHDGSSCQPVVGEGMEGCEAGELRRLLEALPPGLVDLVLGGHTHGLVARRVGGTAVVQGRARGEYLSWAEIAAGQPPVVHPPLHLCGATVPGEQGPTCDKKTVRASEATPAPAIFHGEPVVPDAELQASIEPALLAAKGMEARSLGIELKAPVTRAYGAESALGNLAADAFRLAVPGAQVGMTNGGGLRADLPVGPLTWGDVFRALPFDNHLAVLDLTGVQLRAIVQHGIQSGHGALSFSGLEFQARGCEILGIRVGGRPLADGKTYKLVTSDYLSGGGSGFDTLGIAPEQIEVLWESPILREIVAAYLAGLEGPLDPASYFDPSTPRQGREGPCEVVRRAGS